MSEIDFTIQSGAMTEMYSFFPLYPIWIPQQVQSVLTSRRIPFLPFIPSTTTSRIQGNTASTLKLIIPFNLLTWSSAYYPGLSLHISTQGTFLKSMYYYYIMLKWCPESTTAWCQLNTWISSLPISSSHFKAYTLYLLHYAQVCCSIHLESPFQNLSYCSLPPCN